MKWCILSLLYLVCAVIQLSAAQCDGGPPLTLTEHGTQEFTTPNFPNGAYPVNARCSWLIQVTSGTINLEFPDFNLPNEFVWGNAPCANTKIDVFDGPTTSSRPLGIYCENTPPPVVTSSTGISMLVSFTGGAFPRNGQGFRANFTVIGGNPVTTTPPLPDSTTAVHMTSPPLTTADTDECSSNPCQNGATCQDGVNSYTCTCPAGYEGDTCATAIYDCAGNPCQNGGTCTDRQFFVGYFCTCPAEFGGLYCEIDLQSIDECASNPCQHGGTCTDAFNSYTCSCTPGFQGDNCETDIDECASGPCQHGGACTDLVNSYICSCASGFQGTNCEIETAGRCASSPCQHGATCVDIPNSYICSCAPGFLGSTCQIDMNECASGPCQNGGTCVDLVDSYTCSCVPGFQGTNCDTATTAVPPTTTTSASTTAASTTAQQPDQTSSSGTSEAPTTPVLQTTSFTTTIPTTTPLQSTTDSSTTTRTTQQADTTAPHVITTQPTDPPSSTLQSTTTSDAPTTTARETTTTSELATTSLATTTPEPTTDSTTTIRTTQQLDTTVPDVITTQPTNPPHTTSQEDTTTLTSHPQTSSIPQGECASYPCENGGTCTERQLFAGYYCTCPTGYGGTLCEIAIATVLPATTSTTAISTTQQPRTTESVTESTRHLDIKPVTTGKPGSNGQQNGAGGLTEDEIILYAVIGAALALLLLLAIIVAMCFCMRRKKGRYGVKSREQELEKLERLEMQDSGMDNPAQLKAARPDSAYQSLQGSRSSSLDKEMKEPK